MDYVLEVVKTKWIVCEYCQTIVSGSEKQTHTESIKTISCLPDEESFVPTGKKEFNVVFTKNAGKSRNPLKKSPLSGEQFLH